MLRFLKDEKTRETSDFFTIVENLHLAFFGDLKVHAGIYTNGCCHYHEELRLEILLLVHLIQLIVKVLYSINTR